MTLVKFNGTPVKKSYTSLFDELLNDWSGFGNDGSISKWSSAPVNIHETKDAYHLELSAPGLKKEDIKLNVEDGLLSISYEKKESTTSEDYKTVRREFTYNSFKRSFTLSDKINAGDIQAKYEDGVLKVFVPKKPEAQAVSKQIDIQ
ncbi:heat-shock protein Hsp20 [Terrimonas sp.]|uniref:Hsp20/alpha crystallin family protein n=1 Tax=Terrimonas sp. TaxID=1914338 RepID=UPI000D51B11E|nr:Hsp20/alpha crystallin family protein [Terrimonas sp.]PVD50607.1 heat-shock protein Hsp20 [Terrimonas sp.]